MVKQRLTCSCGHTWEHSSSGSLPAELSTICPVCTSANQCTLDHSSTDEQNLPSSEEMPLQFRPGEVISGFEILEELSRGGMGVIYKARQQGLNRLVALKMILPDRIQHAEALRRFQREVQAAALLSHPNIVTVFHTDLDGPTPYLAMEYVPGIDLSRLVKRGGPVAVSEALYYVQQAAHGLQHAFEQGLVHRDIKPANLMVTPSPLDSAAKPTGRRPRVKILDMGLARVTISGDTVEEMASLTQAGVFLGTPDYVSPEQAEDPRAVDIRSDLYSLGGTLYFLLVGEVPFREPNLIRKLRRMLTEAPPSPADARPDVPRGVDALVRKLMSRDPAARFQTPADLIAEIDRLLRQNMAVPAAPKPLAPAAAPATVMAPSQVRAHPGGIRSLALAADGKWLLSGGVDEALRLWPGGRLQEVRCIAGDVGPVEGIALAPGAKWAASCALRLFKPDMVVQLWDLSTGQERRRLRGHADTLHAVAISPDGRRVASGSADHTIRVFAIDQAGSPSLCLKGHTGTVTSVQFLPGGDTLLSGSHDGTVRLWDSKTGTAKGSVGGQVGKVAVAAFGGPSKQLAIGGNGLRLRQTDGTFIELLGAGLVFCLAFSKDGKLLLTGGRDRILRLWRAADGTELHRFEGHTDAVHAVALSPDGRTAFSGSADGTLRRWPIPTS